MLVLSNFSYSQQTAFFDHIQTAIESLAEGDSIKIEYTKSGDWGAYEGGRLTLQLSGDQVKMTLVNRQNYLGARNEETSTTYQKTDLLNSVDHNKRSYYKNPDNTVFNNSFNYRILKEEALIAQGFSPLEPSDVVNTLRLSHHLENKFFNTQNGVIKNHIGGN